MSDENPTALALARKERAKQQGLFPEDITLQPGKPQTKSKKKRKKRKAYWEMEYPKGKGKLCCEVCLLPYRDHDTFPCTNIKPQRRNPNTGEIE